ncbi:aminotransferase class V-fold PLP-dependent enzyme [Candidatus Pinguicoccus supinus]|uniref:Aminotransferase class V-fold PLP-dependent enzyme n=1 Tax=Candidatus Pinguicoccus supinus TaxID=2529394 RepID=A0A7T0BRI8_9BACT|nr:aminotransferase class V-fold PLP-dependent enzyme [Candidatus Pinguicoccus supinus]
MNLFKYIKQQSPLLNIKKYLKYNHIVFLDNAASTQKPCSLLENQTIYYSKYNSNVNRGSYKLANKNSLLYNKSRLRISKLLNCRGSNNVVLLSGGTEAFNFVQNSFCSKFLKNNDNVILSILEHHSNIIPWILLSIKLNIKLKFIGICTNGYLNFLHYIKTVDKHTKFISLVHVSNLLGLINPIAKFSNISSVLNIPFLIDGTQYIIHNRANVLKYKCDFYIFSSHKVMSSFGVGVLYINDK